MSYTALPVVVAGEAIKADEWGNVVRQQLLGVGSGICLGSLHASRGYRALSTSYVLPDDYGRVRVDHDRIGTGWSLFALFEVIVDSSGTVRVEIVDLSGPTQVVEMSAVATDPTSWTLQTALVIPTAAVTGVKYYSARLKGGSAAIGVGMVGGIYLAAP